MPGRVGQARQDGGHKKQRGPAGKPTSGQQIVENDESRYNRDATRQNSLGSPNLFAGEREPGAAPAAGKPAGSAELAMHQML